MKRIDTKRWRAFEGTLFQLQPVTANDTDTTRAANDTDTAQATSHAAQRPKSSWSVTLRLDAVRELGVRGTREEPLPCYALLFSQQAPERGHAPQGTYRLEHPDLGSQELFIVPLGPSPTARMTYEIVLN